MELDSDDFLNELTWKQFKESKAKFDTAEEIQELFVRTLLKTITQFNRQVDYNSWIKRAGANASFVEKVDKLFSLGAKTYTKKGLKY